MAVRVPVKQTACEEVPGMDQDKIRGTVKEAAGKVTDDEALESQGQRDQAKGKLKDAAEGVKDAAKDAKDAVTR
jgi:uncharacterized protein YjbJ (UPF0337 family)